MTDLIKSAKKALEGATPGPWSAKGEPRNRWIEAEDYWIANTLCNNGSDENEANARLIAMSPDLARALIAAEELEHHAVAAHDELALWFECANYLQKHGYDMGDTERAMNALNRALIAFRAIVEGKE